MRSQNQVLTSEAFLFCLKSTDVYCQHQPEQESFQASHLAGFCACSAVWGLSGGGAVSDMSMSAISSTESRRTCALLVLCTAKAPTLECNWYMLYCAKRCQKMHCCSCLLQMHCNWENGACRIAGWHGMDAQLSNVMRRHIICNHATTCTLCSCPRTPAAATKGAFTESHSWTC